MLQINVASVLGFAALVLIALVIVKVLVQKSVDPVAKGLLLALLLGFTAMLCNQLYAVAGLFELFPHYSYTTVALMFSVGPLLYCNIQRIVSGRAPWQLPNSIIHWLLPILLLLAFVPYYWQSAETKAVFIQSENARLLTGALYIANYIQIAIYLFFSLKPLRQFEHGLCNHFSDIQRFNIMWLRLICWGLVALIVLDIGLPLLGFISAEIYSSFLIANSLFLAVVAYTALGTSPLQFPVELESDQAQSPDTVTSKYSRSSLRQDSAQYLVHKLAKTMDEEQLYLQEDLSLSTLAKKLNTQPHHLSQVLNEQLDCTFYDYINQLRIDHAKNLLLESHQQSVIDIAYASGFNNKVTFYNAFKRYVGVTPTQYRRQKFEAIS